jgi:hypothetical protein
MFHDCFWGFRTKKGQETVENAHGTVKRFQYERIIEYIDVKNLNYLEQFEKANVLPRVKA